MRRDRQGVFVVGLLLLIITLWIVWPAFAAKSPAWMGSGDGFILAKARFLAQGLGLGSWNRYWFLGIPGQHIGSPVIPLILSLVIGLTGLDPVSVWRSMVSLGVLGSVGGIFFFVRALIEDQNRTTGRVSKLSFGDNQLELLFLPIFIAFYILLMPSVLVFFPQIWRVAGSFGWPSWMLFSPFYLGDGYKTVAFGLLIVSLILAWRLIQRWNLRQAVTLTFMVAGLMLVDSVSFLTFFLWIIAFLLVAVVQSRSRKVSIVVLSARLLTVLLFGFILVGFWFTPGYIYTFLGSPSLGGRPFTVVFITLSKRLLTFFPAFLGVIAARRWLRKTSTVTVLGLMGILVFATLTFAGFFADPDFWTDYSRFGRSLDLSVALVVGGIISKSNSNSKRQRGRWIVAIAVILVLGGPFLLQRGRLLRGRVDLAKTAEYRVASELSRLIDEKCVASDIPEESSKLSFENKKTQLFYPSDSSPDPLKSPLNGDPGARVPSFPSNECPTRAFLSGSSVFWLNSWFDVAQVRGGGEMGAINDWWPHGSFQIREGRSTELAQAWLEALGVSFLVVHGLDSEEVYHDFRFPSKFEAMEGWEKIWEAKGDVIYTKSGKSDFSIARIADTGILKVASPKKGDDIVGLRHYTNKLRSVAELGWKGRREVEVKAEIGEGEGLRLGIAYTPFWRIDEASVSTEIIKDPLGMIFLKPSRPGSLTVRLRFTPWLDLVGGFVMTVVALYLLLRNPQIIERTVSFAERFVGRESELDRTAL